MNLSIPFYSGIKIGVISGLSLSAIIYTVFYLTPTAIPNSPLTILLSPFAVVVYRVLVLLSLAIIPIVFVNKRRKENKKDIGVVSGLSWSFAGIQGILFLIGYPSVINDLIKDGHLILFAVLS